ncbi:MAG: hypothetical protein QM736_05320 [Vicinamibacterales bacterium]
MGFRQTYQLGIGPGQTQALLDIPTRNQRLLRIDHLSVSVTHAITSAVRSDVATVLESNGFLVRPTSDGKPDVALASGATLRILSGRTAPSADPIRVIVEIEVVEV